VLAAERLGAVLRRTPHLVRALRAAREVGAPAWLICAGAIRDAVWDPLHDRPPAVPLGIKVPPFRSCAEAVATFPETASCVGVRLLPDDDMLVVAPHGLDDLLGGVCRHNPTRVPVSAYEQRVAEKGWRGRWPRLRYC
jgi:uncharacterized protein